MFANMHINVRVKKISNISMIKKNEMDTCVILCSIPPPPKKTNLQLF